MFFFRQQSENHENQLNLRICAGPRMYTLNNHMHFFIPNYFLFLFFSTIFRRKRLKPTKWNCLNMFVYDKPFDSTTTTSLQLEKHKVYRGFLGTSMFPMQNQENATNCFNCQKSSKQTHENINEPIWTSPKNMILLRKPGKELREFFWEVENIFRELEIGEDLFFLLGFFDQTLYLGRTWRTKKR